MSKGSKRRPTKVPFEQYSDHYDRIYGKKKEKKKGKVDGV